VPLAILGAFALVIAGGAFGLREFFKSRISSDETRRTFQAMQVSRFTASGNILTAAISPDGKYVATVLDESGLQSLWMRQVAANTSSIRLIAPALLDYWGLTFSNDSNFIYYVSWVRNESDAGLYALPVLGGTPRKLPTLIDTPISFSPAGDHFAYVFSSSTKGESYVKMADLDGGGIQMLAKRQKPEFFAAYPGGPAWSPDGKFIAYAAGGSLEEGGRHVSVFVANAQDKTERQLTVQSWLEIGRVAWLGDGSGLVISAREQMDAPRQLWFVSYPDGAARKITNDLHDYDNVSLTADGKTLAAVQIHGAFSISVAPHSNGNHADSDPSNQTREIFSEVGIERERIAWTPDNRLVYCSRVSGNWDIWVMNKDGTEQKQLNVDSHNDLFPAVSTDGRYIFFGSDRAGTFNIWRMEIDGSHPTQLTRGRSQTRPEVTPNGQWVVYQQGIGADEPSIWRVPAVGGEPERLTESSAFWPVASPDGRLLAHVYLDEKGWGVAVRPLERVAAARKFPFPATVGSRVFRWTPDGQALAYIVNENGASNIWLQPLNGDAPTQWTNYKVGQLISFAWSLDGQWSAYMRHTATSDVVLLSDFK
jgi:Tol biopolymer transport system component